MSVFSKKHANSMAKGEDVINEINALLSEMRDAKESGQQGGNKEDHLVSEINTLLSDIKGTTVSLSKSQVENLAMQGGKKKSKSKTEKAEKSKTRTKSRSRSRSRGKSGKSGRSMKREEGEAPSKKKRELNPYMKKLIALKEFIMKEIGDKEELNYIVMSSAASVLLKDNDVDLEKAKKNFDSVAFMKIYKVKKEEMAKKKAEKKANKV
jgi:hypothetical protein